MDVHSHPILERSRQIDDNHVIIDREVYEFLIQNAVVIHFISQKRYIEAATALKALEEYDKNKKEKS